MGDRSGDLWRFLNVRGEEDFCLVIAWAVAALRDYGPYPVLVPTGEQGSAKSSLCEILKLLIDPNTAPLRALPREDRDLFIAATNSHVLAFDNVSGLPSWISDTLCRLATGGGFAVRQLYTDQDEVLFNEQRPAILNGIEDVVTRPDLADRSIFLQLEPIPEDKRRPYAELMGAFERTRPAILGALLTTAAYGLRTLPSTHLMRMPRMADFAKWATACEGALWPAGTFADAYDENRRHAIATCIEADPIVAAVYEFMQGRTEWTGTASDLLGVLTSAASETLRRARAWPQTPRVLSGRLTRAATFLRKAGINIDRERGGQKRTITIRAVGAGHFASPQSQPSSQSDINALGSDDEGGGTSSLASQPSVSPGNGSDANKLPSDANKSSSVTANSLKTNSNDDDDDNDAEIHLSPAEPVCPTPKYAAMAAPHMRHLGTASKTRTRDRKNKKIKAFYG